MPTVSRALAFRVHGVVQGVGFRPFVFRLARAHGLSGWVRNDSDGVIVHVEGPADAIEAFAHDLQVAPPPAAVIADVTIGAAVLAGYERFSICDSGRSAAPSTRVSPDLPVCDACLRELFDPADRRYRYPYINCTNCGPRFSIVHALPYDRPRTTMADWPMCADCRREYDDPADRRFHAQPIACPACGPGFILGWAPDEPPMAAGYDAIAAAARLLQEGRIVAVKGLGGYHLACDARSETAVEALRTRKFRKEKPFALMGRDLDALRAAALLIESAESLLQSTARPIVLVPASIVLPAVAPDNAELGAMLPYAPLHHLLFDAGAPSLLVMTSANRSSEPIAYEDADAYRRLAGLADALLVGERRIARRVEDSVARADGPGPIILRRARGYAPGAVAELASPAPIVAAGGDLKNTVTVVVGGQAFMSQHVGDLDDHDARRACRETIDDLVAMYEVDLETAIVAHDAHPQYASTALAQELPHARLVAIQHHRAHIASVLAEHAELDTPCLGVAFDGTGFGDDGTIWGGEVFVGSVAAGFARVAHLRPADLAGGDAAARVPVQAAAGFVWQLDSTVDLTGAPFHFPPRFEKARALVTRGVRTFRTTSVGRLFDATAALLGFTRPITFEGQAAAWLEHLARRSHDDGRLPFGTAQGEIDWRPALEVVIDGRCRGTDPAALARAFHRGLAAATAELVVALSEQHDTRTVAVSGGVFQNELFTSDLRDALRPARHLRLLGARQAPPNDGGLSLGQAALASFGAPRA